MDPVTAALLGSLGSSIIGTTQAGAPAPAFNPQGGGLLDTQLFDPAMQAAAPQAPQNFAVQSIEDLIGRPESRGQELSPQVRANDFGGEGPVMTNNGVPDFFRQGSTPESLDTEEKSGGFMSGFNNFLGGIDQGLQSPSKVLGLGLLNQIDPRLAGAGLLGMGFLGRGQ